MMNYYSILLNAVHEDTNKPSRDDLLKALLAAEKNYRKEKTINKFQNLLGSWRLCFITGSQNTNSKLGKLTNSGFYLPAFLKIVLTYQDLKENNQDVTSSEIGGKIENKVKFGLVEFCLNGPVKFIANQSILAFDFTYLTFAILGITLYRGEIRGGKQSEDTFYQETLKKQAFFRYFLVDKDFIAARGRGGGLALWKKENGD